MLSIMILPNFKGSVRQFVAASIITIAMDSIYLIPIIKHVL